jgi:putative nucleotidyltransferase with HDIG domain
MEKEKLIQQVYSRIEELPTLPVVVPRLINLIEDEKSDASGVTEIISHDPALTAKILKVANSAYYGFSQKISELEYAVALLGFNMVKSLALSIGIIRSFPEGKNTEYFSHDGLWLHSLTVGTVMNELAKKHAEKNINKSLFIIGLLHDVGKLVFDQFFHEDFQKVIKYANENDNVKLHDAELEVIGIDHCELAGILLERWNFPPDIMNPIKFHHFRALPDDTSAVDVALLRISNILAQDINIGVEGNPTPNPLHDEDLGTLGMDQESYTEMKNSLAGIRKKIDDLFWSMK